jgi:hypothetical protein
MLWSSHGSAALQMPLLRAGAIMQSRDFRVESGTLRQLAAIEAYIKTSPLNIFGTELRLVKKCREEG